MGATSPERHREVAVTPFQSDLTGATQRGRSRLQRPRATSRSDPSRSLPKPGATSRSDYWRSLRAFCLLEFISTQGPFGHFIMHVFTSENLCFKYFCKPRENNLFFHRTTSKTSFDSDFDCFHLVFLLISCLFLYMINLKSNMGLRGIMEISE